MAANGNELAFLSYAHDDLDQVWEVYNGLKKRKVNVWFDKEDLTHGRWKPQIVKAINRSKYFIICLSNAAIERTSGDKPGFQDQELLYAYEIALNQPEDKFSIVPVRLEDCDRGDHRLSVFQQYDLFLDWEKELDKLAVNIGGSSLSDITATDIRTEETVMIDNLMGKAATFYYLGEYTKAVSLFEAAIHIKPDDEDAWHNKGIALDDLGSHKDALTAYDKAIDIKPDYEKAWSNKGTTLAALGRHEDAITAYDKAIDIKPDYEKAWYNKGTALATLGRHKDAITVYDKAIDIKPDYEKAWYNKGTALAALGRYKDAITAYDKAIDIKPDYEEAWYNKGNALDDLGRHEDAITAYDKAIDIKPDDEEAWYNKACAFSLMNEKDESLTCFRKAIEFGYNNLSHIKKDKDLDFIRGEKEFQEILKQLD
jgi:tetratricopeptide (TPR) repeat protein